VGLHHSPKIVTSGLVYTIDAANSKSYPGSGSNWTDLISQSNNTLTNSPAYSSANGGSILFDGTNDYVIGSTQLSVNFSSFTVIAWAKHTASIDAKISSFYTGDPNNIIFMQTYLGNFRICNSENGCSVGTAIINDGAWKMYTMVGDSTSIRGYINNNATPDITQAAINKSISAQALIGTTYLIGGFYYFFNGNIALVSIYNRALSTSEIRQNFNAYRGRFSL
jgi:hypothetical protein